VVAGQTGVQFPFTVTNTSNNAIAIHHGSPHVESKAAVRLEPSRFERVAQG
jgi:hypothetical protein